MKINVQQLKYHFSRHWLERYAIILVINSAGETNKQQQKLSIRLRIHKLFALKKQIDESCKLLANRFDCQCEPAAFSLTIDFICLKKRKYEEEQRRNSTNYRLSYKINGLLNWLIDWFFLFFIANTIDPPIPQPPGLNRIMSINFINRIFLAVIFWHLEFFKNFLKF